MYEGDETVHIVVDHKRRIAAPPGVCLHRCAVPVRELQLRSELPTTSRRRTAVDLIATLPIRDASPLLDRALQRGWLRPQDLDRRLREYPNRPGNRQLRRLQHNVGDGAAAESERVLHRLLRRAGIRGWLPNHEIWAGGELVAVVDVALPVQRIAIEVDGMAYHVDVERFRRDRTRQNALVGLGWTVLRFTWADLTERPGYVINTVRRLAA